ncbi:MAG: hypothetical protein ACXVIJ_14790, partial [Thermoanaerobaculia bacterium]
MKQVSLFVLAAVMAATSALAAANVTEKSSFEYPLDPDGSVWIDNPFGNIEVIGSDSPSVAVSVVKITRGVDQAALAEGRAQTVLATRGDHRMRQLGTAIPDATARSLRWQSFVSYTIHAPRTAHIKVSSTYSDRIRIADISADITVKNVAGEIVLENVSGPVVVDSVNGNITYIPAGRPAKNAQLATVNGRIQVALTQDASFQWIADTIQGDFRTTFPVLHPRFNGRTFHGLVNGGANPTITTSAMMGDVFVLRMGTTIQQSHSVRVMPTDSRPPSMAASQPVLARHFQAPVVEGDWVFATSIGNIAVGEVRGDARIDTGAGTVQLGLVTGECNVTSHGGELDLGDIMGPLTARTDAGSISVNAARAGGTIITGGGMIRVMSTGGPVTVSSGGGDVIVRQANGNVSAQTRSGDVSISIVASRNEAAIEAKTGRGNVVLNVSPRFAADIDATVITSDAEANRIDSDLTGLTIRREPSGQRTRIHATGKVNGGGDV